MDLLFLDVTLNVKHYVPMRSRSMSNFTPQTPSSENAILTIVSIIIADLDKNKEKVTT